MVKREIKSIINKFRSELVRKDVPISGIMLFGSQSNGEAHHKSDIDLLLITDVSYLVDRAST